MWNLNYESLAYIPWLVSKRFSWNYAHIYWIRHGKWIYEGLPVNTATVNTRFWLVGSGSIYLKLYRSLNNKILIVLVTFEHWSQIKLRGFPAQTVFVARLRKKEIILRKTVLAKSVEKTKLHRMAEWLHFSNPLKRKDVR